MSVENAQTAEAISHFKHEACESEGRVPCDVAYASFLAYCENEGLDHAIRTRHLFTRRFTADDPTVESYVTSVGGQSRRCYRGIDVLPEYRAKPGRPWRLDSWSP